MSKKPETIVRTFEEVESGERRKEFLSLALSRRNKVGDREEVTQITSQEEIGRQKA